MRAALPKVPQPPSVARSTSIIAFAYVIMAILGYTFNVALGWLLSVDQYGVYGVSIAIINILTIFVSLGFPWAAAKLLSAEENEGNRYRIFRTCLLGNGLVAVVSSASFYAIYAFLLPPTIVDRPLVFIVIAVLLVSAPLAIYLGTLQGLLRLKALGAMQVLMSLLRMIGGIGLVWWGYGALGAIGGYLIGETVALVVVVCLLLEFKFWRGKGWWDSNALAFAPAVFSGLLGITLLSNLDIKGNILVIIAPEIKNGTLAKINAPW